ncbi:hypothetical protein ACOMHN_061465 [Nucella lapillus]
MPRRRNYREEDLQAAIQAVKKGKGLREAARLHGVPPSTITNRMKGRTPFHEVERTVITAREEDQLVAWIKECARRGFGRSMSQVQRAVQTILNERGAVTVFKDNLPGKKWISLFMKRHRDVSFRTPQALGAQRAVVTVDKITDWFKLAYDEITAAGGVLDDPSRIFNCDETGFQLGGGGFTQIIASKNERVYQVTSDTHTQITVLACVSASGEVLDPLIIFPGKRFGYDPLEGFPEAHFAKSDNGWIDGEIFATWLKTAFIPATNHLPRPVILFLDGHKTHVTMAVSDVCRDKGIILYQLPSHSSHVVCHSRENPKNESWVFMQEYVDAAGDTDQNKERCFLELGSLKKLFSSVTCPRCDASLNIAFGDKMGFSREIRIACEDCNFTKQQYSCSRQDGSSDITVGFDVNSSIVMCFNQLGLGEAALQKFSAIMSIPGLAHNTYRRVSKKVSTAHKEVTSSVLNASVQAVHDTYTQQDDSGDEGNDGDNCADGEGNDTNSSGVGESDGDNIGGGKSDGDVDNKPSSSDSGGDGEDDSADQGVNGLWLPILGEDPGPNPIGFTAVPGPKHPPLQDARPIDYVNLFFPPAFVGRIVEETNTYSQQWIDGHHDYLRRKPTSIVHQWIKKGPTTPEEFRAFLGVTFNMGLIRKTTISSYWDSCHPSQKTAWFLEHFSRDRFQLLMKFLHCNNNQLQPPPGDPAHKLYKIQPLIDHLTREFLRYYHPDAHISIDESMVGYKGKTPHLRQFMPLKRHARFGIKLWCVCDALNGYTSFFELFTDLYQQGTTATGTVRANRRSLPRAALNQRLQNHQVAERWKGNLLCVVYKDVGKKPVLLTTATSAGFQEVENRRGQQVRKPKCVVKYNKTMGGVDLSDARLYVYLSERRTMKWSLKVAFSLFGRAVLNAYIIYEKNTSDRPKLTRYQFMVQVVEGLAGNYYPPKVVRRRRTAAEIEAARENPPLLQVPPAQPQPGPAGDAHDMRKLPVGKKRNCVAGHNNRVRSAWECPACDVGLCPGCFVKHHRR